MISDFRWQPGVTPLSSPMAVAVGVVGYCLTVALLPRLLRRPVSVPAAISGLHNLILCFGSLAMFIGAIYESLQVQRPAAEGIDAAARLLVKAENGGNAFKQHCDKLIFAASLQEARRRGSLAWMYCLPPGTAIQVDGSGLDVQALCRSAPVAAGHFASWTSDEVHRQLLFMYP